MGEMLIVKAKIKEVAKGYNVGGDVAEALNAEVVRLIQNGMKRAEGNGRKTLMGKDI